jgi:hypothetical protein
MPSSEFFYGDPKDGLIYGSLLKGKGTRYGPEFNGNISGKGYSQQYQFLQKTPAFIALSTPKVLSEAIDVGIRGARTDPVVGRALGRDVSTVQMVFWMNDLAGILLLDYIFNQQDRPGNIDYVWRYYYVDGQGNLQSVTSESEAPRSALQSVAVPDEARSHPPYYLIQKTQLNDNDAGGRRYTNFTRKFGLLERLRHVNATAYRQLIRLARDFRIKGPLYRYLHDTFNLADSYTDAIAQNTIQAAALLNATCKARGMRFDLDPEAYLRTAKSQEAAVDCDNP